MNIPTLIGGAEQYRTEGFEMIEPFKTYSTSELNGGKGRYFAHFADLAQHDDTGWSTLFGRFFVGANKKPRALSSCGNDGSQYFFHTGKFRVPSAYAPYGNGIAFLYSNSGFIRTDVAMHEMGHSFGWLEDEYHSGFDVTLYYANCAPASQRTATDIVSRFGPPSSKTTASERTQIQSLIKKSASASGRNKIMTLFERAYWDQYGDTVSGCHTNVQNRPSLKSMMNTGAFGSDQFNVVSCGYLLRSITGEENLKSHWQECMKMDGLEKPVVVPGGVQAVTPISRLFALLKDSLFAAVAAPSATTDMRTGIDFERFINVETFSSEGKNIQSEIFENTGDEKNPSWRQVTIEVPGDEIVEDFTRSDLVKKITLSVEGATDAVGVKKGEEAEVVWRGDESIVSCRGSWNPTEKLPPSGTAQVLVTESSTFSLSCLDAEGKAATASVIVSAVNPSLFTRGVEWLTGRAASSATGAVITLSACGEITQSGRYVVENDITTSQSPCLNIHDTQDVQVNCNGHTITGKSGVGSLLVHLKNVRGFSIESCLFQMSGSPSGYERIFSIENSTNGVIQNNTLGGSYSEARESKNLLIKNNNFQSTYEQLYTNESTIEGNIFRIDSSRTTNGLIASNYGSHNRIVNNKINGGAKGLFSEQRGADDGIIIQDENNDVIEDNAVENNWDCGIETLGTITNIRISRNYIKNNGFCGIGGWYWHSWLGNTIADNTIDDAPLMFALYREYGLRPAFADYSKKMLADHSIFFKDNNFINNKFIRARVPTSEHEVVFSSRVTMLLPVRLGTIPNERLPVVGEIISGNNKFIDNDFGTTLQAPVFDPPSMIVDGGGNVCGKTMFADYPLECLSSPRVTQTGSVNLSSTKPTISDSPDGEARTTLTAGNMTLRAEIKSEGAEIRETFGNTIQYRDVTANGAWTDWVTFEVAGLIAGGKATVRHTWGAGAGNWGFRLVADSGGTITETNEQDNYSEATPVFIVVGTTLPPSPPPSGMPKLFLATPVISGRQAGLGKVYAGSMTISAKATNSGDGILPTSSGGFQYSTDGKDWKPWVKADVPELFPGIGHTTVYNWEGGAGVWNFRFYMEASLGVREYSERATVEIVL
ncbi:MAG: hypothetical protein UY50_C0029G0008 [Parcubacteria group bacterium GW2011_GWA2_49_9]|nr:MAG: hypothetical protein UY50_C0029G0008 [Parcubacteria group bacterium GW2011_GWA2_49_9]